MPSPIDALSLPFVRTALVTLALLAVAGGVIGTWIVLRRLAFFTHAVGAAAFPALVVAGPAGVSPQLAALAAGLGYAAAVERVSRASRDLGAATGLLLVALLGAGVLLASDVVRAPAGVDRLLFGTLLGLHPADVAFAAAAAALAIGGTALLGRVWLVSGFDPEAARLGLPVRRLDAVLLALVAVTAVAAIPAVGALLLTSLFIVPAATARLLTARVPTLLVGSVALAALESVLGLYLAFALDLSPGPAIAVVAAAVYAGVALTGFALTRRRATKPAAVVSGARAGG